MGGGRDFERGPPTVEGEAQALARDLGEEAAPERVASLAADVHLNVVHRLGEDEVEEALFVGLVFAGGERDQVLLPEREVGGVVVGGQGLFEPGDAVRGHILRQLFDCGQRVAAVAHAPPGVGVHHQVEIGPDRLAHEAHGFEVLFRARRGAHFVGAKAQAGNCRCFGGVGLRGHIHAGAAIETDAVAHAPAQQF